MTRTLGSAVEGESFTLGDTEDKVLPKCENTDQGQWVCLNHQERFGNNLQKDGHIQTGTHVLAWMCFHHGIETP